MNSILGLYHPADSTYFDITSNICTSYVSLNQIKPNHSLNYVQLDISEIIVHRKLKYMTPLQFFESS